LYTLESFENSEISLNFLNIVALDEYTTDLSQCFLFGNTSFQISFGITANINWTSFSVSNLSVWLSSNFKLSFVTSSNSSSNPFLPDIDIALT
jgi:hypothetical protein